MALLRPAAWFLAVSLGVFTNIRAEDPGAFGQKENRDAGLIGILYDFKQTQKRQPTGVKPDGYTAILGEFLTKNWSESVLNRYFRATRPLYATQIFMPLMDAGRAPKAFEMEKVIKPAVWVVYYKGQVSPPEDGNYRFVAYADDVVVVAVNGKTVLVGGRPDATKNLKMWTPPEQGPRIGAANGNLLYGDWITLKKDEPVDLDVLVGERPGGSFCAFLLYEKQGEEYPKTASGVPKLPLFQLAPYKTSVGNPKDEPPFSEASAVWKGYQ